MKSKLSKLDFDSESGMGDITFDLGCGRTTKTGLLWAAGIVSTIPTATEDTLGADLGHWAQNG